MQRRDLWNPHYGLGLSHRPFISSVGQSPKPQGISVVPRMRPKMKPKRRDVSNPTEKARNPDFWKIYRESQGEKEEVL